MKGIRTVVLAAAWLAGCAAPQFTFSNPELKAQKLSDAEYRAAGDRDAAACDATAHSKFRDEWAERAYAACMSEKGWQQVPQ